jgi:catechol 2,3-dioxygenase-like lactoylglutathione lyase family enzyme
MIEINVADIDSSAAWYQKTLGMRVVRTFAYEASGSRGVLLEGNGVLVELNQYDGARGVERGDVPVFGFQAIAIRTGDVDCAAAALARHGARIIIPPKSLPDQGLRFCAFKDNEGNTLEFWQSIPVDRTWKPAPGVCPAPGEPPPPQPKH